MGKQGGQPKATHDDFSTKPESTGGVELCPIAISPSAALWHDLIAGGPAPSLLQP